MPRPMTKDEIRATVLQTLERIAPNGGLYGRAANRQLNSTGRQAREELCAACQQDLALAGQEVADDDQN